MLKPALKPALAKEVDQSIFVHFNVMAEKSLFYPAHTQAMAIFSAHIVKMQEFVAKVCLCNAFLNFLLPLYIIIFLQQHLCDEVPLPL